MPPKPVLPIDSPWKLMVYPGTTSPEAIMRISEGLVKPASPTPSGMLNLSVIDRLPILRCNARTIHVFKSGPAAGTGRSAVEVIKDALARALVPYYPLAGRLNFDNTDNSSVIQIECCGEGVWFVEASVPNCTLEAFNYFDQNHDHAVLYDSLLPHHPPETYLADPLVLMQVTQFACGGFVIGLTFCHSICDGLGAAQFLRAVGELARSNPLELELPYHHHLTVAPVWHRDFLPTKQQEATDHVQNQQLVLSHLPPPPQPPVAPLMPVSNDINYQLQHASIDIPLDHINHLKHAFHQSTGLTCSAFEIVAATLWKHRTLATTASSSTSTNNKMINNNSNYSNDEVLVFFANCRELVEPPLPQGFYGNCFFPLTVAASSDTLSRASNADVVKMIQQAKSGLPNEFQKWIKQGELAPVTVGDPYAPPLSYTTLFISEWGRLGFNQVDYGWGPPIHVVPVQGSPVIPVAIMGSLPLPRKGIRLMTWCVHNRHLQPFLDLMSQQLNN